VVGVGVTVTLEVRAVGDEPLSYQWRFEEEPIAGATSATLTLADVRLEDAGRYDVVVTNAYGEVTSRLALLTVDPTTFTKITTGPIAEDRISVWGLAWGDFDNDGYPDLLASVNPKEAGSDINALYRNQGDGTFARVYTEPFVSERGRFGGGSWVDFDNDGQLDLYVPDEARAHSATDPSNHLLYRGIGGGQFARIRQDPAVTDFAMGWGTTWGDFDNDGYVDLFVVGSNVDRKEKNHLFMNTGAGGFAKVLDGPLVNDIAYAELAAASDFDHDGDLDLLVSCHYTRLFYRNRGDGTFDRILTGPIPSDDGNSAGPAWGDYDNDGDIDLCLATLDQTLHLFNNDGAGNFTRTTLGPNANYQVPNWVDYNNDGWLDLFVTVGYLGSDHRNRLFRNNGDGSFSEIHLEGVTTDGGHSFFNSWADFDNDGFPDLVVANSYQTDGGMFIYRNNGNANHWLKVRLIGTVSNRSSIGAKVRLLATIGGKTFWQLREIPGGCSTTKPDPRALFGLGDATTVERVRIEWPSGIVQELSNLPANKFLTVTEPPRLRPLASNGFQIQCWLNQSFDVEASTDLATWTYLTTLTNETGTLEFHDQNNHDHFCRYYRVVAR